MLNALPPEQFSAEDLRVDPIIASVDTVLGGSSFNSERETNPNPIEDRQDAQGFSEKFLQSVQAGITGGVIPNWFRLYTGTKEEGVYVSFDTTTLSEEEKKVVEGAIAGFIFQIMYADSTKDESHLGGDLAVLAYKIGESNQFTNLIAKAAINAYYSHLDNYASMVKDFGPVCSLELTDVLYQLPPFRQVLMKLIFGEILTPEEKKILLDWVIENSSSNYADDPNGTIGNANLKFGYIWSDTAIKARWERQHVEPLSDLLLTNCAPYATRAEIARGPKNRFDFGTPQRQEVKYGGKR